jgi:hypothetical protein
LVLTRFQEHASCGKLRPTTEPGFKLKLVFKNVAISLDRVQLLKFVRPKTTPKSEELELGLMK